MVNTTVNSEDKVSLEQMVKENSGLVWSIVKRFIPRGYDADDLYQIGCIGLIKAVRRFDPAYKVQFSTYAVPLITGEIKRFLRDDGMVKVSRRYKEINAGAMAVKAKLEAMLSREPTVGEIAEVLGISIFDLTEAMEACLPCDSIYRTVSEEGKGETYLLDKLSSDSKARFSGIHDLRMRSRNGRCDRIKGHRKMVQGQGNGIGNGTRDGYRTSWRICSPFSISTSG